MKTQKSKVQKIEKHQRAVQKQPTTFSVKTAF